MSFIDNLKGIADKASEEIQKAAEEVKSQTNEEATFSGTDLMNNLKSMASKANEEAKKNKLLSGGDLSSRHKMSEQELESAWKRAEEQMNEDLSADVECYLQDIILPDECCIYKIRNSAKGKASQMILSDRCLYIVSKGIRGGHAQDNGGGIIGTALAIGQISIRVYPIKEISFIEIKPNVGLTTGHLQVFTSSTLENDNETKFTFDTKIGYFKSVLVYRKLMELKNAV